MKQKIGYTVGVFLFGASVYSTYTAPATSITKIGAYAGILAGLLIGYTVDLSGLRGDNGE